MSRRTTFAGLLELDVGEPLETDGASFIQSNIRTIDRYLEIGAVAHRHNGAEPIDPPLASATLEVVPSGGSIPSDVTMFVGYTLVDEDGGETLLSPISASGTLLPSDPPEDAPSAVIDYTGGALRADIYYYALTFLDGEGNETPAGPWVDVEREPGYASGQVQLTEMGDIAAAAGMPAWALYRAAGGTEFHYLASGDTTDNAITDDGNLCADCSRRPPTDNRTNGAHSFIVTVPDSAELAAASAFRIYMTADNEFTSPSLLGEYPIASADVPQVYRSLATLEGQPPDVPTTVRGASLIDPDTELLDWHWKRPVASSAVLPAGSAVEAGDVRIALDTMQGWAASADGGGWEEWPEVASGGGGGGSAGPLGHDLLTGELGSDLASATGYAEFEFTDSTNTLVNGTHLMDNADPQAPIFMEDGVYTVDASFWLDTGNEDADADVAFSIYCSAEPGDYWSPAGGPMRALGFVAWNAHLTVEVEAGDVIAADVIHNSDTSLVSGFGGTECELLITKIG